MIYPKRQRIVTWLAALLAGCGPKMPESASDPYPGQPGSASSSQPDVSGSGDASSAGDTSAENGPVPRLMVLSGPTGVGAAKLMADADAGTPAATVEVVTDNTQVQTALANGDVDIAAIATNAAASLYAKTGGKLADFEAHMVKILVSESASSFPAASLAAAISSSICSLMASSAASTFSRSFFHSSWV